MDLVGDERHALSIRALHEPKDLPELLWCDERGHAEETEVGRDGGGRRSTRELDISDEIDRQRQLPLTTHTSNIN